MKRLCFIGLLLIIACKHVDPRSGQKKAEDLVKHYLDSALKGQGDYKIINFGKVDTIFSDYDRVKYGKDSLKADSIKKHFKPQINGWSIYTVYEGNDAFGVFER